MRGGTGTSTVLEHPHSAASASSSVVPMVLRTGRPLFQSRSGEAYTLLRPAVALPL
jgi:hypothetical protein